MEFNPLNILKKKETTKVGAAALSLAIAIATACEKKDNKKSFEDLKNRPIAEKTVQEKTPKEIEKNLPSIKITKDEFDKFVSYINTNGKLYNDTGEPLKQFSIKVKKNTHIFTYRTHPNTIRLNPEVIRDVVFTKGSYIVYVIDQNSIRPHVDKDGEYRDDETIQKEIKQFLDRINR